MKNQFAARIGHFLLVFSFLCVAGCGGDGPGDQGGDKSGGAGGGGAGGAGGMGGMGGSGGGAADPCKTGNVYCDPTSGLMWHVQVQTPLKTFTLAEAKAYCAESTVDGFDDWHLPSISELRTIIRGCPATETSGSCAVTDDCSSTDCEIGGCGGCELFGGPLEGCYLPKELNCEGIPYFWSTVPNATFPEFQWGVDFRYAGVTDTAAGGTRKARCVRTP